MQFFSAESREKKESLGVLVHGLQTTHSGILFLKDIMQKNILQVDYLNGWEQQCFRFLIWGDYIHNK